VRRFLLLSKILPLRRKILPLVVTIIIAVRRMITGGG